MRRTAVPNYVYSGFRVTGDRDELKRFRAMMIRPASGLDLSRGYALRPEDPILDFEAIIPPPPHGAGGATQGWAIENWGVKWNAQDLQILRENDDLLWFQFTTAWDFPTPVFEALAAEFRGLVFDGSSYEESDAFELVGQFNGDDSWGPGKIEWTTIEVDDAGD